MRFQKRRKAVFRVGLTAVFLLFGVVVINTQNLYAAGDPGKKIFDINCADCHGQRGDSKGFVCFSTKVEKSGRTITTYARDFTAGVFRFRTTPTGCLPAHQDLVDTITKGIAPSFMPSFQDLSATQKDELIAHVTTFSERWEEEDPCDPIPIVKPDWVGTPASVKRGEQVYKEMKCWECHGDTGKGDGKKSNELKDDWGHKIVPFDFTTGELKRGTSPEAIYITFTSGLDGTGMASFQDTLNEESRWDLVSYTLKLMGR
ncbi:MAG: c-type cytochrome [Desulfobacteraceae bacterium]